jgi:hypothetical protein
MLSADSILVYRIEHERQQARNMLSWSQLVKTSNFLIACEFNIHQILLCTNDWWWVWLFTSINNDMRKHTSSKISKTITSSIIHYGPYQLALLSTLTFYSFSTNHVPFLPIAVMWESISHSLCLDTFIFHFTLHHAICTKPGFIYLFHTTIECSSIRLVFNRYITLVTVRIQCKQTNRRRAILWTRQIEQVLTRASQFPFWLWFSCSWTLHARVLDKISNKISRKEYYIIADKWSRQLWTCVRLVA